MLDKVGSGAGVFWSGGLFPDGRAVSCYTVGYPLCEMDT